MTDCGLRFGRHVDHARDVFLQHGIRDFRAGRFFKRKIRALATENYDRISAGRTIGIRAQSPPDTDRIDRDPWQSGLAHLLRDHRSRDSLSPTADRDDRQRARDQIERQSKRLAVHQLPDFKSVLHALSTGRYLTVLCSSRYASRSPSAQSAARYSLSFSSAPGSGIARRETRALVGGFCSHKTSSVRVGCGLRYDAGVVAIRFPPSLPVWVKTSFGARRRLSGSAPIAFSRERFQHSPDTEASADLVPCSRSGPCPRTCDIETACTHGGGPAAPPSHPGRFCGPRFSPRTPRLRPRTCF